MMGSRGAQDEDGQPTPPPALALLADQAAYDNAKVEALEAMAALRIAKAEVDEGRALFRQERRILEHEANNQLAARQALDVLTAQLLTQRSELQALIDTNRQEAARLAALLERT